MDNIKQFDRINFIFNPKKLDTLRYKAKQHIGKRLSGMISWVIEEGVYKGQFAISSIIYSDANVDYSIGWIPQEDCDDIKKLESSENG